jgi:hypothetical protein
MIDLIKCLTPGCERVGRKRGLCNCCYNRCIDEIKAGRTTWETLVSAGLALAAKTTRALKPRLAARRRP